MAGAIWHALNTHGERSLAQLKKLAEIARVVHFHRNGHALLILDTCQF